MTVEDLKKLDRQMRQIQDPFGAGLPSLHKLTEEWAQRCGTAVSDIVRQYAAWKGRK